jgi:hypothetical protein
MGKPAPETDLQNEGRLCIGSLPFVRLYRNNVGTLEDRNGTPVSYGLAVGSADTIGIVAPTGRFLSIEWKRPGWKSPELRPEDFDSRAVLSKEKKRHRDQCNWRDQVIGMGGVAGFATSLEEGMRLVGLARIEHIALPIDVWVNERINEFRERMASRGKSRKSNTDR